MVAIAPTDYLKHNLDPLSHAIDGYGGAHVLMGLIASGGEPHIYIVGNVKGNLKKEIYEALSEKLKLMADPSSKSNIISIAGEGIVL